MRGDARRAAVHIQYNTHILTCLHLKPICTFDDSAGDGDALLLPPAELRAALAAQGVVLERERHDEVVGVRGLDIFN